MDFSWTEDQLARRQAAAEFAKTCLNEGLAERDRGGDFPREAWERCAEFGVLRSAVPEVYGGSELDLLTTVLVMEGLGHGCRDNGLILALNAQIWTVQHPIVLAGTEEQKQTYLPRLCSGEWIGAQAITEKGAGSDAFSLSTSAIQRDDGYVLNGKKRLITLAPVADLILLFASTAPDKGKWGVTAFLVERSAPGLSFSPIVEKMGLRTVPMGEIELTDCWVPSSARLGREGSGVALCNMGLEYERGCMLASYLGVMERQLEETVEHARTREQFGEPIGKFQSVSNRIADMKVRLEAARHLVYRAAWLKASGKPAMLEAAIAKLFLSEGFVRSSEDAMRVFGGDGYLAGLDPERNLRDSFASTLYGGTSDIQRQVISRLLGL